MASSTSRTAPPAHIVRRRASAVLTALLLTAMLAFSAGWVTAGAQTPVSRTQATATNAPQNVPLLTDECPRPLVIDKIPGRTKKVALTFDDGPHPETTPKILDILKQYDVKATFFETGEHATAWPQLVSREVNDGHAVGAHTWNHPHLPQLSGDDVADQLAASVHAIRAAAGRPVCLFRPPYGQSSPRVDALIAKANLTKVMWTRNTLDWELPGPEAIAKRALQVPEGWPGVVLLHIHGVEGANAPLESQTVQALPTIIKGFKARGYEFVRVDGSSFATS